MGPLWGPPSLFHFLQDLFLTSFHGSLSGTGQDSGLQIKGTEWHLIAVYMALGRHPKLRLHGKPSVVSELARARVQGQKRGPTQ